MNNRAYNNYPTYDDDLVNKVYVDEKIKESSSEIDPELEKKVEELDKALKQEAIDREEADTNITNNFDTFITEDYNPLVQTVDSKIESWSQTNDPSLSWTSQVEKQSHLGDIWYNESSQKTYVYKKNESVSPVEYYWQWQDVPIELLASLDSKSTIFSGVIPENYKVKDYWIIPLNIFSNTHTITTSPVGVKVGDIFTLGIYTLEVLSVNDDLSINEYSINISNTSNYDLTTIIQNLNIMIDGYSEQSLIIAITSIPLVELPESASGGTICVAIKDNTTYNKNDFIIRNNNITSDKVSNELVTNDKFDSEIIRIEIDTDTKFNLLDDRLELSVTEINNTIIEYDNLTKEQIESLDSYTKTNINQLSESDGELFKALSTLQIEFESSLTLTRDEIIQKIQVAGGTNYLQNSVGYKDNYKWTNINGRTEQPFITNLGEIITISFKYKKTKDLLSNIKLVNSDSDSIDIFNSYSITDKWNTVIYSYTTISNNPYLSILGSFIAAQDDDVERNSISGSKLIFDNGLEITDLYIANGDKTIWSPYFNETYGKTHTLDSDGLSLKDIATDNKINIDSTSVDIYDGDILTGRLSKNEVISIKGDFESLEIGNFIINDIGNNILTII